MFSKKLKQASGVQTLFDFLEGSGAISKEAAAMLYAACFGKKSILGLHQASLQVEDDELNNNNDDAAVLAYVILRSIREPTIERVQLSWDSHVLQLVREGAFSRTFRMDVDSFRELITYIAPYWTERDATQSMR